MIRVRLWQGRRQNCDNSVTQGKGFEHVTPPPNIDTSLRYSSTRIGSSAAGGRGPREYILSHPVPVGGVEQQALGHGRLELERQLLERRRLHGEQHVAGTTVRK